MGSRRFANKGGLRRSRSGGGAGGGGAANTAAGILGSALLLDWYSTIGASGGGTPGAAWVDQVRGVTAAGTNSPVLATDGANFNGLPVWKFLLASAQVLDTGAITTIVPVGSAQVYLSLVFRQPVLTAADQRLVQCLNGPASIDVLHAEASASGTTWGAFFNGTSMLTRGPADTSPHLYELFLDTGGVFTFGIDGSYTTVGAGLVTAADLARVGIGSFPGIPSVAATVNIARVRFATFASVAQRAQLRALDRTVYGVP